MKPDSEIFQQIASAATQAGVAPVHLTMDAISQVTGLSRSSLYRRFGSRQQLNAAMIDHGMDVGIKKSAEDRLLTAAHDLIVRKGVQALTLESVAAAAEVALPTVYGLFGNRPALMYAVFSRYSPIPRIADQIPDELPTDPDGFERLVEHLYTVFWDFLQEEKSLIFAIVAEISRDPNSVVMEWLRTEYLSQVAGSIFPIVETGMQLGVLKPAHPLVTAQALIGPMLFHFVTRPLIAAQHVNLPERNQVCAVLARQFCAGAVKGATNE